MVPGLPGQQVLYDPVQDLRLAVGPDGIAGRPAAAPYRQHHRRHGGGDQEQYQAAGHKRFQMPPPALVFRDAPSGLSLLAELILPHILIPIMIVRKTTPFRMPDRRRGPIPKTVYRNNVSKGNKMRKFNKKFSFPLQSPKFPLE